MLLHKITPTQINFFRGTEKAKASSLIEMFVLMNTMFNKAIEWGCLEVNLCTMTNKPKRAKTKRINYYTESYMPLKIL